jgi:hypothetical protein
MLNRIADLWCQKMHREAMWPIHGRYVCRRCLREHAVNWEGPATPQEYGAQPEEQQGVEIRPRVWLAD